MNKVNEERKARSIRVRVEKNCEDKELLRLILKCTKSEGHNLVLAKS